MHGEHLEMRQIVQGVYSCVLELRPCSEGSEGPFIFMLSCVIARFTFEKGPFWLLTVRKLWICRECLLDWENKKLLE